MIYVFDVDGTLTPSRQYATEEMIEFLREWGPKNRFYLCSGSDYDKIMQQLPGDIIEMSRGVFGCMGNSFHRRGKEVYRRDFNPPIGLRDDLVRFLEDSPYPHRHGNHIEERIGMWNFSIVGRNATQEQREHYADWESNTRERHEIAAFINEHYSDSVCVTIGGEISMDINNPGADKAQVLPEILKLERKDKHITFVGDRTLPGGNDYALAVAVREYGLGQVFQTESWKQTKEILISLS